MVLIEWRRLCFLPEGRTFPSPYGDYGSYRDYKWEDAYAYTENVSVPLRGLWFLSPYIVDTTGDKPRKFPSPYGDYGSYRRGNKIISTMLDREFPSPYGDYGSYHQRKLGVMFLDLEAVSVPLRGLWFLSLINNHLWINTISFLCFRPLTGIMVLILPLKIG